ncbi:MAG: hypothetical protein EAZ77_06585 [Nostocales cyanobacterium]|nr:MAG: hypothetical protein EAZ77_06585 [Nostocales cyanobacterium]
MLSKRLCLCFNRRQSLLKFIPIQSMGTRNTESGNEKYRVWEREIQSLGTRNTESGNEKNQKLLTN